MTRPNHSLSVSNAGLYNARKLNPSGTRNLNLAEFKLFEFDRLWASYNRFFDDATGTYDIGDIHNLSALKVLVASSGVRSYVFIKTDLSLVLISHVFSENPLRSYQT